jgi:hypothetical protein
VPRQELTLEPRAIQKDCASKRQMDEGTVSIKGTPFGEYIRTISYSGAFAFFVFLNYSKLCLAR